MRMIKLFNLTRVNSPIIGIKVRLYSQEFPPRAKEVIVGCALGDLASHL
jgi:hypothetical protein